MRYNKNPDSKANKIVSTNPTYSRFVGNGNDKNFRGITIFGGGDVDRDGIGNWFMFGDSKSLPPPLPPSTTSATNVRRPFGVPSIKLGALRCRSVWLASEVVDSCNRGGLSLPLIAELLSSSMEHSDISTSGIFGATSGSTGATGLQTLSINRYAASRLIKLPNTCRSSAVATPTAFWMIFAVFSFDILTTDTVGMSNYNDDESKKKKNDFD